MCRTDEWPQMNHTYGLAGPCFSLVTTRAVLTIHGFSSVTLDIMEFGLQC